MDRSPVKATRLRPLDAGLPWASTNRSGHLHPSEAPRGASAGGKQVLLLALGRQRLDQVDHLAADLGIGDADERPVELQSLGAVQEVDNVGRRVVFRQAGCIAVLAAGR